MQIDDSDLEYLLADEVLPLQEQTLALDRSADTWEDQGYMLLLLLLPLVLALFRRGWIACLLPALFALQPQPSYAGFWDDLWLTPDQQGQRALERGDPQTAAGLFKDPDWVGTASYQGGDYEAARGAFSTKDNADGWYNRGNALAREGKLEQAIEAYRESLARKPEQADAEENIALLEQLRQQQQQQQQSGEGEQEQDQEQDQEQNQGSQQQDDGQQQRQEQNQDQGQSQDDRQQQQSQGDQQQRDSNQQSQQDQQQPGEQEKSAHQEQESPAEAGEQPQSENKQAQAQHAQADPEQQERDQAMEQWLRRVPDDPSGLLREKFRYESQQRQQQGVKRNDESYW
jgi:Ca-activated chloride channel family protein